MRIAVVIAASSAGRRCSVVRPVLPGPVELTPITPSPAPPRSDDNDHHQPEATGVADHHLVGHDGSGGRGARGPRAFAWVEGGPPVDDADFRVALRGGTSTSIGARTPPSPPRRAPAV